MNSLSLLPVLQFSLSVISFLIFPIIINLIYLSSLLCCLSLRFFNLCYNNIYLDDKNNIYSAHISDAIWAGWVVGVSSVGKGCHDVTSCVMSWGDTVTLPTEEAAHSIDIKWQKLAVFDF